ncbi:MAG: ATP-binding protein [Rhodothermales bacterium]
MIPTVVSAAVFYGDMLGFGAALLVLGALFSYGKRQVLEAQQQRAWLASFPELSPEPVVEIIDAGDLTYVNPAGEALFPDLSTSGTAPPFFREVGQVGADLESPGSTAILRGVHVENRAYEQRMSRVPEELEAVADRYRDHAEATGIALEVMPCPENGDAFVPTDPEALRQIMNHIVDNALKFTHSGRVTLAASTGPDGIMVRVDDTGIGMPDSFLAELYTPFRQASQGLTRTYEGSGLGLTIVRRLADLLHAELDVESAVGEGTSVTLVLPRAIPSTRIRS